MIETCDFGIDPRIGAAATRAQAASRDESPPQAILKVHRSSSLDYRALHGFPVNPTHTYAVWKDGQK